MKEIGGPDNYWSAEHPVSRGQYQDIALLACRLLGLDPPQTRLDATVIEVRMRRAISEAPVGELPQPW